MWRHLVICGSLIGLIAAPQSGRAQVGSSGLVSPIVARRLGLARKWFTQIELDRSRSRIVFVTQFVSSERFFTVHEVKFDGRKLTFTELDLDDSGQLLGREGAKQLAERKHRQLVNNGVEATLDSFEVPHVELYVQTDGGTLHALDGETGRTIWSRCVGHPQRITLAPAADDRYVASVNGSTLFVFDRATGEIIWQRKVRGAPGAGPGLTQYRVFVPMVDGMMESYRLQSYRQPPWLYKSHGHALLQPTVSAESISWPTDRGYFYVARPNQQGIRFRLEATDAILGRATYQKPNRLFVASADGYVYAIHEKNGDVVWRFSTGETITHSPIVIGDSVYAITDHAGMFSIDVETGTERWWTPRISKFVAASNERLYCMGKTDRLVVIDAKTGGHFGSMPMDNLDLILTNWKTDRIYVGTTTGTMQCLHETQLEWPLSHIPLELEEKQPEIIQIDLGVGPKDGGKDPFAAGAGDQKDPFEDGPGGGVQEEDPFESGLGGGGQNDDPFGGGNDGGQDDDPFGAGNDGGQDDDDPFGF